ncbi:hypothetical protein OA501_00465 [Flavobacteriaceae bacterium]|nr:hypothetical protein [Flavobacteriaceae bacterium]
MEEIYIIIGTITLLLIIGIISIFFSKKAIIKRKLRRAPLKSILSFRNGDLAKIVGSVELVDPPLKSPLSQRSCCYFHVVVEQHVKSGKNHRWKKVIDIEKYNKYVLNQEGSYAYVNTEKLKSYLVQDKNYSSGIFNQPDKNLLKFLKEHGYDSKGFLGINKRYRYKEGVLEKGEKVAVLGQGQWKIASEFGLPNSFDEVLGIHHPTEGHVYLTDDLDLTTVKPKKNQAIID